MAAPKQQCGCEASASAAAVAHAWHAHALHQQLLASEINAVLAACCKATCPAHAVLSFCTCRLLAASTDRQAK
jgi:hypothetical protein